MEPRVLKLKRPLHTEIATIPVTLTRVLSPRVYLISKVLDCTIIELH